MLDYHIHTNFSDGQNTIEEMVKGAWEKGLTEFGISDHFTVVPRYPAGGKIDDFKPNGFCEGYSMKKNRLGEYVNSINLAKDKFKDKIILKAGIELEYFLENWGELCDLMGEYSFDYIIGCVHKNPENDWYRHICDPNAYIDFTEDEYVNFTQKNLELIIEMAKTGKCDIIAHTEAVCGYRKMKDFSVMYDHFAKLCQVVKENNMCIEMNCWETPENWDPNLFLYKECGRLDIPVIITSDAHEVENINQGYEKGIKVLNDCKVKYTATYFQRKQFVKEILY